MDYIEYVDEQNPTTNDQCHASIILKLPWAMLDRTKNLLENRTRKNPGLIAQGK